MHDELYTVVVADDEPELREAVCQMIRWEDIGLRLATAWTRCSWWSSCSRICC